MFWVMEFNEADLRSDLELAARKSSASEATAVGNLDHGSRYFSAAVDSESMCLEKQDGTIGRNV